MSTPNEDFTDVLRTVGETPCVTNPDAFFAEDSETNGIEGEQRRIAKKLCETCPVINECLNYAMTVNEPFGIWGGLTFYQRRVLRRKWRK